MLTEQRKRHLLDLLARDGRVVAADAARDLTLSEDTIRRDLRELAAEGRLTRVHGGALPLSPTHLPMDQRRDRQADAKARLARAAAPLVKPGMVIAIDGGTTNAALIRALPRDLTATVVTHSPTIAASLEHHAGVEVVLLGGRLYRHSMVALGPSVNEGYARIRADIAFVGVTGLDPKAGLTTGDWAEAEAKRALLNCGARRAVLVTPDKIGTASPFRVAGLDAVTDLFVCAPFDAAGYEGPAMTAA